MSLEDLIKEETGNNFKEKLMHYSKFTATSLYRGAIDIFRLPTANRLRREAQSQRTPAFLEEVIGDSVKGSLQIFMLGTFLLSPPLGLTALATNTASYIYETFFAKRDISPRQNEPMGKLKRWSRNFAKYACTYTLVGSMALGHLFASSALRPTPKYDSSLLNVEVQKISLNKEGKKYEFYLLGEAHLYNYSSSIYVEELIKQKNISLLLSEGVDLSGPSNGEKTEPIRIRDLITEQPLSKMSWRNVCEGLIGVTYAVTLLGTDYIYREPSEICYDKGIPVIFLEKPVIREYERAEKIEESAPAQKENETFVDGREGVGDISYAFLGASGIVALTCAPQLYFFATSARNYPLINVCKLIPTDVIFSGILDKRNELMTKEAFKQITENSGNTCLIRVGLAHVDGVIEEFKKYGDVSVENVKIDVK